jgi:hypothetical protein
MRLAVLAAESLFSTVSRGKFETAERPSEW